MELVKGVVRGFDSASYRATVQLAGSLAVWLEGVPVARNIPAAQVTVGRGCVVLFFDEANPRDAVVLAVYE
ncbi:MAG: hypothetical protein NZ695_07965 [Dehalococcoidia bacterium]|jgi:pyrroline-5-carboxylate reductase|nr:hypothetical protein [Dehalococcoidia bacterium]MDW8009796.1 hypothetical protein [Chloroflexota bacterium]